MKNTYCLLLSYEVIPNLRDKVNSIIIQYNSYII